MSDHPWVPVLLALIALITIGLAITGDITWTPHRVLGPKGGIVDVLNGSKK